jgi:predicted phosphodiesterase
MNILVISDLHIDTRDNFGMFQWNEMEFVAQVEKLREIYSVDKIILNGDIFELLKYSYEEIKKAYPVLISYISGKDFVLIKGNHDKVNGFGITHFQITNSKGQTIYIEHGHKVDWFNGTKFGNGLGKTGLFLLKLLSGSNGIMKAYLKLVFNLEQIDKIPKRYNTLKYLTYALKLLKEHDVVILSHTHKLESHHTYYLNKKKRYLNSGSCSLGRFEGIILNTETLRYELIKETKESVTNPYPMSYAI